MYRGTVWIALTTKGAERLFRRRPLCWFFAYAVPLWLAGHSFEFQHATTLKAVNQQVKQLNPKGFALC